MITIIHGDDIASSRNYLNDIKVKFPQAITVEGESTSVTDLTQIMEGGGLFITEKSVIIEHLFAKKKAAKEFEAIVALLIEAPLEHDIFIWESKELDKRALSVFKHATVKTYKLPQTLFLFLDSLKPRYGKELVKLYHKVLDVTDAEMIFFMLIRQIRLLLALRESYDAKIDEVKRLAPWQINKLQKQAALFTPNELINLHTRLYELDKAMKTGQLPVPLTVAIDILLVEL